MGASMVAQTVKNSPAVQGPGVLFLGQEDSLEKGMTTCSIILALENSMDQGIQSMYYLYRNI